MILQSLLVVLALILGATQFPLDVADSTSDSEVTTWPPIVILDNFTMWDDGLNNYGFKRTFSEDAIRGNEFITLGENDYYNACFSTSARKFFVEFIGIRIVYSLTEARELKLQLIHQEEKSVPSEGQSHTRVDQSVLVEDAISTLPFAFDAGKEKEINIPIEAFTKKNPFFHYEKALALKIPGDITIHRVELGIDDITLNTYFGATAPENIITWIPPLLLRNSMQLIQPIYTLAAKPLQVYFHDLLQKSKILTIGQVDITLLPDVSDEVNVKQLFTELSRYIRLPSSNLFQSVGGESKVLKIHESPRDSEHYQIVGYILGMAYVNMVKSDISFEESINNAILTNPKDVIPQVAAIRLGILEVIPKPFFRLFRSIEFGEILSGKILDSGRFP